MSTERNRANTLRFYDEVWNKGDLSVIDELYASDAVADFLPPGFPTGTAGLKQFVMVYRTAFPDTHFTIEDLIAEADSVVTRWTATGTQAGPLMNIPPTGKQVTVQGISITRYAANGKAVQAWTSFDQLGMLQQLGVIPSAG